MNRAMLAIALLASCRSATATDQSGSSGLCDVPVVAVDYYNQPVRGLKLSDFSAHVAGALSPVSKVSADIDPKRVAIILDASGNVPAEEWNLETEMALELLSHARSGDQFLLLLVGNDPASTIFSSSTEVAARIRNLAIPRNNTIKERIYDALLEAARHFDPPQFGDAIFLFGHYRDSDSTASFDTVHDSILRRGLRFFAISFEDRFANVPRPSDLNKPLPNFHPAPLESLSDDTGYYFSYHAVHNLAYPGQIPLFKNFLSDLYTWIAEPYRVQITIPSRQDGSSLEIAVTEMNARKINQRGLHFPHSIYECTQQPAKLSAIEHSAPIQ